MNRRTIGLFVILALLLPLLIGSPLVRAQTTPVINEFVFNHTGTDTNEYIEVFGGSNTDYATFTILEIEGDGSAAGTIDGVFNLGSTDADGFWFTGFLNNALENGTVTLLLVENFSGSVGADLDGENDGTLDSTPWTQVVDGVAVLDGDSGDQTYTSVVLAGGFDGDSFAPGGASRIPNGSDTDSIADWMRNDFDGAGLPGFSGTPALGEALNTPGAMNQAITPPPPPFVTIPEIQGSAQFSSYDGTVVETSGVVTLFTANGAHCWVQDPAGDGDAATSDGIFVSGCGFPSEGSRPEVGDFIRIIASVDEQQFGNALPLTRLTGIQLIEVLSAGNSLPTPVLVQDLPDVSIPAAISFWEPLEGMLVAVDNAPVVAPTSGFGEFAMLAKDDAKPGSGFYPQTQQILLQSLGLNEVDYNPERILVDDSSLDSAITVMPGDRVRHLVGVVDYTFGNYKLQPASFEVETHLLPELPASTRSGPPGDATITTFNVENLFDLQLNQSATIDVIGQIGVDPGSEWGTGAISTQDNTIRRKSDVCQGDADGTDPFDPSLEWVGFPQNTFDGLGAHTVTCGTTDGLLFSEYVEGSSLNKALEIYNGTGAPVNLGPSGYIVEIYFNGSTSPGQRINLVGTIADGDVFVLANPSADQAVLDVADQVSSGVLFNGDDAVALVRGGKDDAGSTPTPEQLEIKLNKLSLAIQIELELPEVLIVQEVENTAILQTLGDQVNAATGTDYVATSFETSDARGIEVGFLWDANRVTLLDAFQMSGPDVEAAFGPTSPSPGREPLVGVFDIGGQQVTIIGNHFKSKGGDDALFGVNWPPERITEAQRKAQARVVRDFVNSLLDGDPDALVMVAGDLNDFPFGEPGEGPDHPLAILEGDPGEIPLTNLVKLEKEAETFTYVFDGNSQVLDHMLVSPALLDRFTAVDLLHFNASFPNSLSDDATTPLHSSDHDPVEGRFDLP